MRRRSVRELSDFIAPLSYSIPIELYTFETGLSSVDYGKLTTGNRPADGTQCFFRFCSFTVGSSSDKSGGPLPPPSALLVASSRSCRVKSLCFLGGENKEDSAQIAMPKPARAAMISTQFPPYFSLNYTPLGLGFQVLSPEEFNSAYFALKTSVNARSIGLSTSYTRRSVSRQQGRQRRGTLPAQRGSPGYRIRWRGRAS